QLSSVSPIERTKSSIERLSERGLDSVEESHGFRDPVEGQNTCSVIQIITDLCVCCVWIQCEFT
ncbi:hypothetical protein L3Q82_012923, partial [Scortum barcoo]